MTGFKTGQPIGVDGLNSFPDVILRDLARGTRSRTCHRCVVCVVCLWKVTDVILRDLARGTRSRTCHRCVVCIVCLWKVTIGRGRGFMGAAVTQPDWPESSVALSLVTFKNPDALLCISCD